MRILFPISKSVSFVSKISLRVLFVSFLAASSLAHAYKIDAHIFIAQEVLNDAQDGILTFEVDGSDSISIPINSNLHKSLVRNPETFRVGSIGPDSFPDVATGQMIIHPGIESGWSVSDWLMHLSRSSETNEKEQAFVAGFRTHIAADIFAHTYVNRYAGGVFDIVHGPGIATRHVMLESFISSHLPKIKDHKGRHIGKAYSLIDDQNGKIDYPQDYVLQSMYFDSSVQQQYKLHGSQYPPVVISDLRDTLDDLLAPGGLVEEYDDLALRFAAAYFLEINLTNEEAREFREFAEDVRQTLDVSDDVAKISKEVDSFASELQATSHQAVRESLEDMKKIENNLLGIKNRIDQLRLSITQKDSELNRLPDKIHDLVVSHSVKKICKTKCANRSSSRKRRACREHCGNKLGHMVQKTNAVKDKLRSEVSSLHQSLISLENKELERASRNLRKSIEDTLSLAESALETQIAINDVARAFLNLDTSKSPVRLFFQSWRDSIDDSMESFSRANVASISNTINPDTNEPLAPLNRWLACDSKSLVGIPSELIARACDAKEGFDATKADIFALKETLQSIDPLGAEVISLKKLLEEVIESLMRELLDIGIEEINKSVASLTDVNPLHWKELFEIKVDDRVLNQEFSKDEHDAGLVLIPDVAKRIKKDMGVGWFSRSFKLEKFNAFSNSIVLAKLSLLDRNGLIALAKALNVKSELYPDFLYNDDSHESINILNGFVRNIDGNHQWQKIAPPHPRRDGFDEKDYSLRNGNPSKRYGISYGAGNPNKGLRFWVEGIVRENSFKKLFTAPLTRGIDQPEDYGLPKVLNDNYPAEHISSDETPWAD